MDSDTKKLIKFIKELEALKYSERQVYNQHNQGWENHAEHSWHTAMIVWLLAPKYGKRINLEKSLKLALMHDIVHLQATDNSKNQDKIALKLFKNLPEAQRTELTKLYTEYKEAKTPESKLVNSANKIQPIVLNLLTDGRSWKKFKTTETILREQTEPLVQNSPYLSTFFNALIKEASDRKLIYRKFWQRFIPARNLPTKATEKLTPAKAPAAKKTVSKKVAVKKSAKTKTQVTKLKVQTA